MRYEMSGMIGGNGLNCSLFTVHCSLFTVYCLLFTVHCLLFTVYCLLFTVHCSLFIVEGCFCFKYPCTFEVFSPQSF